MGSTSPSGTCAPDACGGISTSGGELRCRSAATRQTGGAAAGSARSGWTGCRGPASQAPSSDTGDGALSLPGQSRPSSRIIGVAFGGI